MITSASNPKVKQARALRAAKARRRSGLFLIEGLRHLGEALEAGAPVEYVLHGPKGSSSGFARILLANWEKQGVPCHAVSQPLLERLGDRDRAPELLAVGRQVWTPLESLSPAHFPWGVALSAPQDPGNVGTVLRTLDAAGASGLILLDGGVDPFHPTAVRASMGALFWHPIAAASTQAFTTWAESQGYTLYGSSAHAELETPSQARFQFPALLLLGDERQGLSPELAAHCDQVLRIPMSGRVTSLNLAVAAGILLFKMAESGPAK